MTNSTKPFRVSLITAALAFAGVAGCGSDKSTPKDFFEPEGPNRKVNQFITAQASLGAKDDGTLYACHFDGDKLNSLGQEKLDYLIPVQPDADVTVYLSLPADSDATNHRREAVVAFLDSRGVSSEHRKLEAGVNPKASAPAARGLSGMTRTDSVSDEGQPSSMTAKK